MKEQLPEMLSQLLFRLGTFLLGALIIFWSVDIAAAAPARFGIWVEAEGENRPFISAASLKDTKEFIRSGAFSDIYAQVYRGGRSWFPSAHADSQPYRAIRSKGVDPLRELIDDAHREGRRVHAWLNILRVEQADVPIIKVVGREGVLRDNAGNSLLNYSAAGVPPGELGKYFKLDTPGIWLDPAVESVRRHIVAVVKDLITTYPDLDGIHLDMIRFPFGIGTGKGRFSNFELGYSPSSVSAFYKSRELSHVASLITRAHGDYCAVNDASCDDRGEKSSDYVAPRAPSGEEWDEWRRLQVTLLVFEIRELLAHMAPRMELSAAVLAWQDRAHDSAYQDWTSWLRGGLIDTAVPMAYTADASVFSKLSKEAVGATSPNRIMMGIGAWLLLHDLPVLNEQIAMAQKQKSQGVVLFSYSNLINSRGKALVSSARSKVLQ